jgi:hypothetical protein
LSATRSDERRFSHAERVERTLYRRAVESAVWGMPIVAFDAMRQAFVNAGAAYNDVVFLSKPADWRFQVATPNASSRYAYTHFNLKDGPIVYEIPAAVGAGLYGSMNDAWQTPLADVGPAGDDQGNGGKYLLIPPDYTEPEPAGYFTVRFATYNGYSALRASPVSSSDADVTTALDLIKQIKLYPLSQASSPPPQRHIDIAGLVFDAIPRFDASFYGALARIVAEERVQTRDLVAMGYLHSLGIVDGSPFTPDAKTTIAFVRAIDEAHATFMRAVVDGESYWPGSRWIVPGTGASVKTAFTFETADGLDVDDRATTFFLRCAPPKNPGAASVDVWGTRDAAGGLLRGDRTYRLRVPANVPVRLFWAVTVYDLETAGFFRESPRVEVNSYASSSRPNADGSIDVYFGPRPPAGNAANWVFTANGKPWIAAFRFYGPEKAVSDKRWVLPDIESVR